MGNVHMETPIWEPSEKMIKDTNLIHYMDWLKERKSLSFQDYSSLWKWSVDQYKEFWETLWEYFDIIHYAPYTSVLKERKMPGATWFQGAHLNYAEHIFRNRNSKRPALMYLNEETDPKNVSWDELYKQTAAFAHYLKKQGVKPGDRVVAFMPNIPETVIVFLACASIGATWACCAPEFGEASVIDRFKQIEPSVFIAVDGYQFNGKTHDRRDTVEHIIQALPTLKKTVLVSNLFKDASSLSPERVDHWNDITKVKAELTFEPLPFDHPLWILYSSGTTGVPKAIVHGHGGIILEHLKTHVLQNDTKIGDRFFWYTSTSWMMWNINVGAMLAGATTILYGGSPNYPGPDALWMLCEKTKATTLGMSAGYIHYCMKKEVKPETYDLSPLKVLACTASPLKPDAFRWIYQHLKKETWLLNSSGGTDVATSFIGGSPIQPVYISELQAPALGVKVESWDEDGNPLLNEVGELVITEPMPSMPLYFWNDKGNARYKESYFETYPGTWRHGDWVKINERGGSTLYGRSDSTINRNGVRIGTSEIYQVVESAGEVMESLVIDLEYLDRPSFLAMFVVLGDRHTLSDELKQKLKDRIKKGASPKHVPNDIFEVNDIPKTLNGKKMEVPIRKILLGYRPEKAVNRDSMANPSSLEYFMELAKTLNHDNDHHKG